VIRFAPFPLPLPGSMLKFLTPAQIEQYRDEGCVFPIRIMSETEAAELRGRLEAYGRAAQGRAINRTCCLPGSAALVRRSSILDTVEDLHGPDLLCWTTNFFIKKAADPAFASWHQDSTYWGLSEPDVAQAWVAFTSATEANGAMGYIPGSHKLDQIPHRDTFAKHNLLTRGQEVTVEVDHSRRRIITLRPGEMSLHHVRLAHGSPPNPSNDRRIGFAIRYIPTDVAELASEDSASSCAARIAITISRQSPSRVAISTPNSWHFTAPSPDGTPGSSIAARTSPATTSRRRWPNATEPARRAG
jgi:non-heme Fe2+,alpha-ketoglutarate-dependent halogenase